MADLAVVNPASAQGILVDSHAAAPGGDRFLTTQGRKYLMRIANGHSSPQTVTVDDPTSVGALGATLAQNPDVPVAVANATERVYLVDANRHRDANGWVNLTYSGTTLLTLEIFGPL